MPRLYFFTPYSREGLGEAYNLHASLLPKDDDWAVFMDFDAMFWVSQDLEGQLQEAIRDHPEYQVFTSMTTRLCVRCQQQVQQAGIRDERDLVKLKQFADYCARVYRGRIKTCRGFFAGYFFAFPKRLWKKYPFPTVGSQRGKILGIDSAWSRTLSANGVRVGVMEGIVATHFYRLDTGEQNISHLNDPTHNQKLPHRNPIGPQPASPADMPGPLPTSRMLAAIPREYLNPVQKPRWYLNPSLRPPGGFKFTDKDGLSHFSATFNGLVLTLANYRKRIGEPIGNPHEEIMAYYVRKFPRMCILR